MNEEVKERLHMRERREPLAVDVHDSNLTEEREREELAEKEIMEGS